MNENDIIKCIISKAGSEFIGDDCAHLKDLGIVVSQDSLVEGIHFNMDWCTPYQLGYKSVVVNISDILASGAEPAYISIAISAPKTINLSFFEQFYDGVNSALQGTKLIGGDITGSTDKIMVSVTAIGKCLNRNISSRSFAKNGYVVITTGKYGNSAAGLNELKNHGSNSEFILSHLEPQLNYKFSKNIAETVKEPYAMMDSSDGLCDALFKIAESSGVKIVAEFQSIPHANNITKEQILFGGEDYNLVAVIPEKYSELITKYNKIGHVADFDGVRLDISGSKYSNYSELNVFNHFGDLNG